jgi:hypothetical protein
MRIPGDSLSGCLRPGGIVLCGLLAFAGAARMEAQADVIWWEAEHFVESNWPHGASGKGAFEPGNESARRMISEGVWLNAMGFKGLDGTPFMVYDVEIPEAGEYVFWARMFANYAGGARGPFRVRFDDGPWRSYGRGEGTTLHAVKPQGNSTLGWVRFDAVPLAAGRHRVRIEILDLVDAAGFDCLVLAKGAFFPNGTLKPGEKTNLAMDGWWAFEPDADTFDAAAILDLSGLNHVPAGSRGWIGKSDDGNDLVLAGERIRFWSVEIKTGDLPLADLERHARFLAKRGVNSVRFFEGIEPKGDDSRVEDIDERVRDRAWKVVAAMRKHGIYVLITPFWIYNTVIQRSWNLPHHPAPPGIGRRKPDGAFVVEPALREAYKQWMRAFLTEPNPYTGIPLAQDPAVWCIQVQNEQSPLFYTYLYGCQPGALRDFGKVFGRWLTARYGSLDGAWQAWGYEPGTVIEPGQNDFFPADDPANGLVAMPPHLYSLSAAYVRRLKGSDPTPYDRRTRDFLRFIAEHMRDINAELTAFLRDDLGYGGLVSANNWKSRDQVTLDDVERWTYTAADVIARHHYIGGPHLNPTEGARSGWQINVGDLYQPFSALTQERPPLPTNFKAVEGFPTIVTESTWVPPNRYQSEGPLLIACYGALTGLDLFNWFAVAAPGWSMPMGKWDAASPVIQGQFPAAALMYRRGYVREAAPVLVEHRRLEDLWALRFPLIAEDLTYDPNVDRTYVSGLNEVDGPVPSQAFLVGPVRAAYGQSPGANTVAKGLAGRVDAAQGIVTSATGELRIVRAPGLFTVNAPRAQGAAGFLEKAGRIALADVVIECASEYASIVVVPLDDAPIASSGRLLVQMGTMARPYGWKEEPVRFNRNLGDPKAPDDLVDGQRITDLGGPHWNVAAMDARIFVRNPALRRAQALDANGMPVGDPVPIGSPNPDGFREAPLPPSALYVVLSQE